MIYNHITPKYTLHTQKKHVKHLRKFSKIKINLRIVINAFQVKICQDQRILDDLQTTIIVVLRRRLHAGSEFHTSITV